MLIYHYGLDRYVYLFCTIDVIVRSRTMYSTLYLSNSGGSIKW